jgi:hypothetical protein
MTMPKLNQIVAIEKGVKNRQNQIITEQHHKLDKAALLSGIARKYTPKDDEGEKLPAESTLVQVRVDDALNSISKAWSELIDITLTKDDANTKACADVVVDGKVLLANVPVTTLLFLEKQLVDLHTVVKKLPTLDPSERWGRDEAQNCWATEPSETTRTKKIPRNHVKAPATDKFPAQVDVYMEDVIVGTWRTIKFSGAMPATRQAQLLERVEKLQRAVKFAREQANAIEVQSREGGAAIFGFLLG